jgi:hypothetical protein
MTPVPEGFLLKYNYKKGEHLTFTHRQPLILTPYPQHHPCPRSRPHPHPHHHTMPSPSPLMFYRIRYCISSIKIKKFLINYTTSISFFTNLIHRLSTFLSFDIFIFRHFYFRHFYLLTLLFSIFLSFYVFMFRCFYSSFFRHFYGSIFFLSIKVGFTVFFPSVITWSRKIL